MNEQDHVGARTSVLLRNYLNPHQGHTLSTISIIYTRDIARKDCSNFSVFETWPLAELNCLLCNYLIAAVYFTVL